MESPELADLRIDEDGDGASLPEKEPDAPESKLREGALRTGRPPVYISAW